MNVFFSCLLLMIPVDISFLITDLKYSQEHGLKICEVQHGSLSSFTGEFYTVGGEGSITPCFAEFFTKFPMPKWTAAWVYPPIKKALVKEGWNVLPRVSSFSQETGLPKDPFSINSYEGLIYADFEIAENYDFYREKYPGILFMNAAILPFWKDKYKMSSLFEGELSQYKADWKLYEKVYDPLLSAKIQEDMPSEFYVIKPRKDTLAKGVIVVHKNDLDHVLQSILDPATNHRYWSKNKDDTFLIEKYYESDYLMDGLRSYDATMRIAFILYYDQGKMTYQSLGSYWKLPSKAIEEEGTLNEKRISFGKGPFYKAVDPELFIEVDAHLEKAMLLLYERMLYQNY